MERWLKVFFQERWFEGAARRVPQSSVQPPADVAEPLSDVPHPRAAKIDRTV
jgi:hypothetical protein